MSAEQDLANANVQIANLISEVTRFRDAAMGLNAIYPTITEGRQAVADGQYFSVPGSGAYMRLYRRQGSSAELIAEFPDRAELNSVIAQLGPLLGRGVTGGPGDLMSKGAFGLGADTSYNAPHLGDITQDFESGFYRMPMSAVGAPAGDANFWASLMVTSGQGGRRYALAHEFLGSMGSKLHVGVRGSSTGEMIWQYALLNTDMVGTVSQSDGVPTGAIIERGSNANGEYVKFADGSLFFSSVKDVNVASSGAQFFTAPVAYIPGSAPSVTVGHVSTSSPNPALYFDNIRALFLDPSAGYALRLKTSGVSSAPGTNSERLIFSTWARWY